ncbi:MAG: protein kinase [Planctomycetota bacterium JB042]
MSARRDRDRLRRRAFEEAIEATSDAERAEVLERWRARDAALAAEVRELLAAQAGPSPLDRPAVGADLRRRLEEERPERVPDSIGPYAVEGVLGRGAAGTVFAAVGGDPPRPVAVKVLRPAAASDTARRRFALEVELLERLDHPNVVRLLDAGVLETDLGPSPYLVTERVEGVPLDLHLRRSGLDRRARIGLIVRIARAVEHAHARGVIHRDLKPANILVTPDGEPHVLDFGIARVADPEAGGSSMLTAAGALLGTLPYASPEQARGDVRAVDVRSDVYSLGVIAFEALAGRLPVDVGGAGLAEIVDRISNLTPPRLSALDPSLAGDLEVVVATALEHDPDRRYATVEAFAGDLRRVLDGAPIAARPVRLRAALRDLARRHRPLAAAAGVALVSLVLGGAAAGIGLFRAREEARRAADSLVAERDALERAEDALDRSRRSEAFLAGLLGAVDPRRLGRAVELADVLDEATATVDDAFADDPRAAADLRIRLTRAYRKLGDYAGAERALAPAVATWEAAGLGDRTEARTARATLAVLRRKLGHVDDALRRLEELVPAAADPDRRDRLDLSLVDLPIAGELASTYALVGRAEDALALRERCDAVARAAPHLAPLLRVEIGCQLATSLLAAGRVAEAAARLEALRADEIERVGEDHADVRYVETYLADVYLTGGRAAEAEAIYRRSALAMEALHGERHPRTRAAWHRVARSLDAQGRLDDAIPIFREQLALSRADEPGAVSRIEALQKLGDALARTGREADARVAAPLLREALDRSPVASGVDRMRSLFSLARAHAHLGDRPETERLLDEAAAAALPGAPGPDAAFERERTEIRALLPDGN